MRPLDDTARMLLMNFITALVTFAVAFGINLSNEQTGAIVGLAAIGITLLAYFFPAPPKPTILGGIVVAVLAVSLFVAMNAAPAFADWDYGGGGPGGGGDYVDWTPCYYGWC